MTAAVLFIIYTYVGFPLLLWLFSRMKKTERGADVGPVPPVSVVIPAFNESEFIGETLESVLSSDFPAESLEILVVSDQSTDRTDEVVRSYEGSGVRLLRQPRRAGQAQALLTGIRAASHEIVFTLDASGRLEQGSIRRLARHFQNPQVGAVSGSKLTMNTGSAVSRGDNLYTRYDTAMRTWESRIGGNWVGCEGGLFAIRKHLFEIDFPLSIAPDTALCFRLLEKGYFHLFDPEITAYERPSVNLQKEFSRKIRVIVLQIRAMAHFWRLFNPFRHPVFFFQNFSHKVFRWLVPFALIYLWVASAHGDDGLTRAFFMAQSFFYALAAAGLIIKRRRKAPWFLSIPAYFTAMNLAALMAWLSIPRKMAVWKPTARESPLAKARIP